PVSYAVSVWSLDELADTAAAGIADANLALRDENAVRGLDHLDEVGVGDAGGGGVGEFIERPHAHSVRDRYCAALQDSYGSVMMSDSKTAAGVARVALKR
ncbi:MAG: hypothetical protein AAFY46_15155, partial [Planctomycetota bacterium]